MSWLRISLLNYVIQTLLLSNLAAQPNNWQDIRTQEAKRTTTEFTNVQDQTLPVAVITLRHPSFGSFHCGNGGGNITIGLDGTRTAEGDVILMNSGFAIAPAVFEVRCEPYKMLHLFGDGEFLLRGQDGDVLHAAIIATSISFPTVSPPNAAQGFTVTASVRLNLEPGQTLSSGAYVGLFQTTWITE